MPTYTKNCPILTVFVPFSIPSGEIPKLEQKARKKFGKNVVLDIKYDPDLVGGAAFAFGGKYYDFSVRNKMQSIFSSKLKVQSAKLQLAVKS